MQTTELYILILYIYMEKTKWSCFYDDYFVNLFYLLLGANHAKQRGHATYRCTRTLACRVVGGQRTVQVQSLTRL
jgi:hypothetical protein